MPSWTLKLDGRVLEPEAPAEPDVTPIRFSDVVSHIAIESQTPGVRAEVRVDRECPADRAVASP